MSRIIASVFMLLNLLVPGLTTAQSYPAKPIMVIIPLGPGSPPETMMRALAQQITPALGQPIVIHSRGGAGGTIGGAAAAKANPDGYTLLMGSVTSLAIGPTAFPQSGFNAAKSFVAVGQIYSSPFVLVTGSKFPAKTLNEFIEIAKAKPAEFNVTSPATGSQPHMAATMFEAAAGIKLFHVPFGTMGGALNALGSMQAHLLIAGPGLMLNQIRNGNLRVLATAAPKRLSSLPDAPTTAEAGLPGFEVDSWGGLVAPIGTPSPIVRVLNAAIQKAIVANEVRDVFLRFGADPQGGVPEAFARLIAEDEARCSKAVKALE